MNPSLPLGQLSLIFHRRRHLETASTGIDLGGGSINTTQRLSLAIGEGVHGLEGEVETNVSVVDG